MRITEKRQDDMLWNDIEGALTCSLNVCVGVRKKRYRGEGRQMKRMVRKKE